MSTHPAGITFPGAVCLLFTGLKLTGHIDWSWWWVTVPLWGTLAFGLGLLGLGTLLQLIGRLLEKHRT